MATRRNKNKGSKQDRAKPTVQPRPSARAEASRVLPDGRESRTGSRPDAPKGPIHVRSEAQLRRLLEEPEPVIIDFWAPWCGPCRMMAPIFEQVARDFDGGVRFLKINTEEVPEVGQALGVRSIPTVVAMQGTEVVDSHVGLMPASALGRMARRVDEAARGVTLGDKVKSWLGLGPSPA